MKSKEWEDIIISFDEYGMQPATLCDKPEEVIESFRIAFKKILQELEKLEYYEKIFNTPLIEIRKKLEVLDQLKEILSMNYLVRVYGYEMAKRLQTYLKSNDLVKQWLEGE